MNAILFCLNKTAMLNFYFCLIFNKISFCNENFLNMSCLSYLCFQTIIKGLLDVFRNSNKLHFMIVIEFFCLMKISMRIPNRVNFITTKQH